MNLFKSLAKAVKGILGLDTGVDLAKSQQAELERLRQQQILDASQETEKVATFDDTEAVNGFTGTGRKRKQGKSQYDNTLGLQIT